MPPNSYMIPVGGGTSVHVIVPIAGLVCLALFIVIVTVLVVLVATGRSRGVER